MYELNSPVVAALHAHDGHKACVYLDAYSLGMYRIWRRNWCIYIRRAFPILLRDLARTLLYWSASYSVLGTISDPCRLCARSILLPARILVHLDARYLRWQELFQRPSVICVLYFYTGWPIFHCFYLFQLSYAAIYPMRSAIAWWLMIDEDVSLS